MPDPRLSSRPPPPPPPPLQLLAQQPLLRATDGVLRKLLSAIDAGPSKTRATVMKALSELVAADASVMREPIVVRVVQRLLQDDSKLVRAEAVDLVGKYVLAAAPSAGVGGATAHSKALLAAYFPMLLDKLRDTGVSTRKRVVGILRDLVARRMLEDGRSREAAARFSGDPRAGAAALADAAEPELQDLSRPLLLPLEGAQQATVLRQLLTLAANRHEEESVKDAVEEAFHAFWFAPPTREALDAAGGGGGGGGASAGQRVLTELAARTAQVLAVVDASIEADSGTEWLVEMLRGIAGGGGNNGRA